jgi:hypothetical protein
MPRAIRLAALFSGVFTMATAWAALDPAVERQIGGVFSNACGNKAEVMIRLYGDVLDIERGGVAVKASKVQYTTAAPAGVPLPDFKAVVRGEVKGGDGVMLVLSHNSKGLFARIDGGAKSLAPLGPGVLGLSIRHCDPNRNALPGAPPPALPLQSADLLRDPRFKAAYLQALGPLAKEDWLARMSGPGIELKKVKVAGNDFALAAVCKPHDCADHNTVILWTPKPGVLHGLVHQKGRNTLIGNPSPDVAKELQRMWAAEWRQK